MPTEKAETVQRLLGDGMLTKKSIAILFVESMLKHKLNYILSALLGAFGMQLFGFVIWLPMLFIFGSQGDGQEEGFFTGLIGILITTLYNLAIFFIPLHKNIQHFTGKLKEKGIHRTVKVISSILGFLTLCYLIIDVILASVLIPLVEPKTFFVSLYDMYYFLGPIVVPIIFLWAVWIAKICLNQRRTIL